MATWLRRDEPLCGQAIRCLAHGPAPGVGTWVSAWLLNVKPARHISAERDGYVRRLVKAAWSNADTHAEVA